MLLQEEISILVKRFQTLFDNFSLFGDLWWNNFGNVFEAWTFEGCGALRITKYRAISFTLKNLINNANYQIKCSISDSKDSSTSTLDLLTQKKFSKMVTITNNSTDLEANQKPKKFHTRSTTVGRSQFYEWKLVSFGNKRYHGKEAVKMGLLIIALTLSILAVLFAIVFGTLYALGLFESNCGGKYGRTCT